MNSNQYKVGFKTSINSPIVWLCNDEELTAFNYQAASQRVKLENMKERRKGAKAKLWTMQPITNGDIQAA